MRRVIVVSLGLITTLGLAACSSGSSPSGGGSSEAPSTPAPSTSAASTPVTPTSTSATASSAAPSSSAASSVGPAPAGAAIKSGVSKKLPSAVDGFTKQPASGPASIYQNAAGDQIGVSFLQGSNYKTIVTALTDSKMKAGTGMCGTDGSPSNATCYLKAADGVYNVSGDGVSVLVTFSNELTAALGTG